MSYKNTGSKPFARCEICGAFAAFADAKHCTNCWEVARRLNEFAKSEKGRDMLISVLREYKICSLCLRRIPEEELQIEEFASFCQRCE